MSANEETLKIISNETKNYISEVGVVTPSIYTNIFSKFATTHGTDIENEEKITNNLLNEKINQFTNLQEETSNNAIKLSEHTDKALTAIKDKDETVLAEVIKETQNLREEIEKLKESIYRDELTNAYNRKWLHDNFLDDAAQYFVTSGTLAIIDLNYFKLINDTYGHIIGDKVLIFIANQLKKTHGHIVRYGGDEFVIMFSSKISLKAANASIKNLRENILRKNLKVKDASFKMSFSIGIEEFKKGDSLSDIIDKADKKMYLDKKEMKKTVTGI